MKQVSGKETTTTKPDKELEDSRAVADGENADENSTPRTYSKEWVRQNYDPEQEVATREAQIAKLVHEWHIALPGLLIGLVPATILANTGAPMQRVLLTYVGVCGTAYALFFKQLWCSTLAEPTDGEA